MSNLSLEEVFKSIEAYNDSVYFVGGCLRQFLLQKPIHDYDFVCKGSAIALAKYLGGVFRVPFFILDEDRDIARVVLSDTDTLDFATLQESSLLKDLALRDLTINAMAYPAGTALLDGSFNPEGLIDPLAGLNDLKKGVIRGISEANFISDPLRLLRIFRFAAQHQFSIDSETLIWVKNNAHLLTLSAMERILSEWTKIISAPKHLNTLQQMLSFGILQQVIPLSEDELSFNFNLYAKGLKYANPLYTDYLMSTVTGEHSREMLIKLYILCFAHHFKDIFQQNKVSSRLLFSGSGRLFVSTQKSKIPIIAALSRNEWSFFEVISENVLSFSPDNLRGEVDKSRFIRQAQSEFIAVILVCQALYSEDDSHMAQWCLKELQVIEKLWEEPNNPVAHPQFFLTGHEVAQLLNQKPGPQIGQVLNQLLDAQALSIVSDYDSAIAYVKGLCTNNIE